MQPLIQQHSNALWRKSGTSEATARRVVDARARADLAGHPDLTQKHTSKPVAKKEAQTDWPGYTLGQVTDIKQHAKCAVWSFHVLGKGVSKTSTHADAVAVWCIVSRSVAQHSMQAFVLVNMTEHKQTEQLHFCTCDAKTSCTDNRSDINCTSMSCSNVFI